MIRLLLIFACSLISFTCSSWLNAHAEHDKARYVSPDGVDSGRCDVYSKPCKSIIYAVQNANKGDNIRLANGNYEVNNTDTLFYLLSQTLPIKANFSRKDNFKKADKKHITRLIGVPLEYAQELTEKGFSVIVDSKGQSDKQLTNLDSQLAVYSRLQEQKTELNCSAGLAGDHPCNNIDLLAHVPLSGFSTNPSEANDIWGHFDLNDFKEYALIGLRNGIGIVEVTDPTNPRVVNTISSDSTIWRDLKVYQFFDHEEKRWKSFAYVTADNASVGLMIIDLNQLPEIASVVSTDQTDLSAHNVYLSNVDYSTGVALTDRSPYLHIAGSNKNGGAFNTYELADPKNLTSVYKPVDATRNEYTHDVSSMVITDSRKDTQCVNGSDHCQVFFDFNENDFQLWDKTDNNQPERLSTTTYPDANYVHSGWFTEDKLVVIVHDELDEQRASLNTTVRFFDMNNLKQPVLLSTWTGPTKAIDHNGFVRGNRYYLSNYERGLTVLDISDPSIPKEAGFFDTYPLNDNASFNGAWGVYPFLPSGNILVSDINSGLYILRDRTLTSPNGTINFSQKHYAVTEGETVAVNVARTNGSQGVVTVGWELMTGAANGNDFVVSSGLLEWSDGEQTIQTINVLVNNDEYGEPDETFFIRLFDPKNGATLSQPSLSTITISASSGNNAPSVMLPDNIQAGLNSTVTLSAVVTDPDNDIVSVEWQQIAGESVNLLNADTSTASFEALMGGELEFQFTATDAQGNSSNDSIIVHVNHAPTVQAGSDIENTQGAVVTLTGTASDADGDELTFSWTQTAGAVVTLSNSDSLQASFTATNAGDFIFSLTATDIHGEFSTASVNVKILPAAVVNPPVQESSGGGGSTSIILLIVCSIGFLRRFQSL